MSTAPATRLGAVGEPGAILRRLLIGLTAFLTLVDLFATQAILPSLTRAYGVSPAAMGLAVNACTLGMALSGLAVALFSRRIDRRLGIFASLALLSVPTALLASAPDITTFTALRVAQGVFMAAAFTLMLAYLAEHCGEREVAGAFAAYITGNVASNLIGRLLSASLADTLGLAGNFYFFAALNLAGAILVFFSLGRAGAMMRPMTAARPQPSIWLEHLRNPALRLAFAIGFLILFVFIGTFTYVNFALARDPFALTPMALGFVYLVFLPAMIATPLAGRAAAQIGTGATIIAALGVALAGLPLLIAPYLAAVLAGLVLVGAGTFFAQAVATGFVGRTATRDSASANGIYLAAYFSGGLAGAAVLGPLFDRFGWAACVGGIAVALALALMLAASLTDPPTSRTTA